MEDLRFMVVLRCKSGVMFTSPELDSYARVERLIADTPQYEIVCVETYRDGEYRGPIIDRLVSAGMDAVRSSLAAA